MLLINKIAPKLRPATAAHVFQAAYEKSLSDGVPMSNALAGLLGTSQAPSSSQRPRDAVWQEVV